MWGGGICCSVVVLCVRVLVSYREVVLCCQKVGGRFEVDSSLSLHMFGKAWVPLVDGQGNAGNPKVPPAAPGGIPIASRIPCMRVGQSVPCPAASATACSCLSVSVCVRC